MHIEFDQLSANKRYHLLTQTVIPRPIAWVLSENDDQSFNLAPFSFFNAICSEPALLVMSIGKKDSGASKDTAVNLLSGRPFTVHIADTSLADSLNQSAAALAYGESEVEANDLALCNFPGHCFPRLEACNIAFYCSLYDHHLLGQNKQTIVYAQIRSLYINDSVANESDGRIKVFADKVDPLARLGAAEYAGISESFTIKRPR